MQSRRTLTLTLSLSRICLAVAVVALRQPRRVQRRNGSHGPPSMREVLRRWTRRYSSQRDEFYHAKQIPFHKGRGTCGGTVRVTEQ